jgi:hypothetical protein
MFACGYSDLAYALRLARLGDIYWRRALLSLRQGNLSAGRHDLDSSIDVTREEQVSEFKVSADASSPAHVVLRVKLETYMLARVGAATAYATFLFVVNDR